MTRLARLYAASIRNQGMVIKIHKIGPPITESPPITIPILSKRDRFLVLSLSAYSLMSFTIPFRSTGVVNISVVKIFRPHDGMMIRKSTSVISTGRRNRIKTRKPPPIPIDPPKTDDRIARMNRIPDTLEIIL